MFLVITLTLLFGGVLVVAALGHNGDGKFVPPTRGSFNERI